MTDSKETTQLYSCGDCTGRPEDPCRCRPQTTVWGRFWRYPWQGYCCPPEWRLVGTIDVGDPADIDWAIRREYRLGRIYRGPFDVKPSTADVYERTRD